MKACRPWALKCPPCTYPSDGRLDLCTLHCRRSKSGEGKHSQYFQLHSTPLWLHKILLQTHVNENCLTMLGLPEVFLIQRYRDIGLHYTALPNKYMVQSIFAPWQFGCCFLLPPLDLQCFYDMGVLTWGDSWNQPTEVPWMYSRVCTACTDTGSRLSFANLVFDISFFSFWHLPIFWDFKLVCESVIGLSVGEVCNFLTLKLCLHMSTEVSI